MCTRNIVTYKEYHGMASRAARSGIFNYAYSNGEETLNEGQNSGMKWAEHTVSSSFRFDGVTRTFTPVSCHVTGLPYTANPPTNKGAHPWSGSGSYSFDNDKVRFGGGGGKGSCSLSFYVPVNISILLSAKIDTDCGAVKTQSYVNVSGNDIITCDGRSYKVTEIETSKESTITSSNPTVTTGTTYGLGSTKGRTYYIDIKYQ